MPGNLSEQHYMNGESATNALVCIAGSFETNGTGEVTNVRGDGFSVARSAAGKYVVTVSKKYPALVSCVASVEDVDAGTSDDALATTEVYDKAVPALTIRVALNSVLTDLDGPRVNFVAFFNKYLAGAVAHV